MAKTFPLEDLFLLGDKPILTIKDGVEAIRDQEWITVYNQAVERTRN